MLFKVVVNKIVDIINFDRNTVRSNLKELCKILKIIKFVSLVNFGSFMQNYKNLPQIRNQSKIDPTNLLFWYIEIGI